MLDAIVGTGHNCRLHKRTAILVDTGGAEPVMSALIQGFAWTSLCDTSLRTRAAWRTRGVGEGTHNFSGTWPLGKWWVRFPLSY